jgi:hypothetical protein
MWPFTRSSAAIDRDIAKNNANLEEATRIQRAFHSGQMSEAEKQAAILRLRQMRSE